MEAESVKPGQQILAAIDWEGMHGLGDRPLLYIMEHERT